MRVAIIIPTFNQPRFLEDCILAVTRNTLHDDWRVVVTDDRSTDKAMRHKLDHLPKRFNNVAVTQNEGQRGFPANVNHGVRYALQSGPAPDALCLLNQDTRVCVGWLGHMLSHFQHPVDATHRVGIVGCKLLFSSDRLHLAYQIQHAGVAFNTAGEPYHIFRGMPKDYPAANVCRKLNAVTFACACIRSQTWQDVGALDETFAGGQFEDIDWCLKARQATWEIVYEPLSVVHHYEHGAGEEFVTASAARNREQLLRRWPGLKSDEYLFLPVNQQDLAARESLEAIAVCLHRIRAETLCYVANKPTREHIDHCHRIAAMPWGSLPPVEQETCIRWAEELVHHIVGGK